MLSSEQLVETFASSVEAYYRERDEGVILEAEYDAFIDARNELARRGTADLKLLAPLLRDPRESVRFESAWALQELMPNESMEIYLELSKVGGTVAFTALSAIDAVNGTSRFEGPPPIQF